ncbi:hypothetical protein [Bosea sp. NBC_00550]|uniref:hypothetical protein n=1 Tax=Bosea sp. NBC_00550 TaxID=2969621 RepID=UPI002231F727|nr:hypothetical protein [Bosea sp. NBC_00550]UZF95784.1 hypothetical protein NWE53_27760 [Bosea sp. NBC_00550]
MYFALTARFSRCIMAAAAVLIAQAVALTPVAAESAYVAQSQAGDRLPIHAVPVANGLSAALTAARPAVTAPRLAPEASITGIRNFAQTIQIGNYNQVAQIQNGANNLSNIGVIAGNSNNVGVLQAGNNLRSNLVLLNTQGLSVGVIQPNGSAPINVLIARLPNGGLLIKR